MTDLATPPQTHTHVPLRHPRLPSYAPWLVVGLAAAAAALIGMTLGWSLTGIIVLAIVLHVVGLTVWSRAVQALMIPPTSSIASAIWRVSRKPAPLNTICSTTWARPFRCSGSEREPIIA